MYTLYLQVGCMQPLASDDLQNGWNPRNITNILFNIKTSSPAVLGSKPVFGGFIYLVFPFAGRVWCLSFDEWVGVRLADPRTYSPL